MVRRPAGPPNGLDLVFEALQRVSNASGYQFEFRGLTNEIADFETSRATIAGADLWIGWAFDDEVPALADADTFDTHTLGAGGPVESGGRIISGSVALRADQDLEAKFGPGRTTGNVLLHELLHALNIDHADDPTSVMHDSLSDDTADGLGDLERAELQALFAGQAC